MRSLPLSLPLQDIEAVDPEYYKNLKWMLENDITDVLDLTFTAESDFFGKTEVRLQGRSRAASSALCTVCGVGAACGMELCQPRSTLHAAGREEFIRCELVAAVG